MTRCATCRLRYRDDQIIDDGLQWQSSRLDRFGAKPAEPDERTHWELAAWEATDSAFLAELEFAAPDAVTLSNEYGELRLSDRIWQPVAAAGITALCLSSLGVKAVVLKQQLRELDHLSLFDMDLEMRELSFAATRSLALLRTPFRAAALGALESLQLRYCELDEQGLRQILQSRLLYIELEGMVVDIERVARKPGLKHLVSERITRSDADELERVVSGLRVNRYREADPFLLKGG